MDPKRSLELLSNVAVELTEKATNSSQQIVSNFEAGQCCIVDLSLGRSGDSAAAADYCSARRPSTDLSSNSVLTQAKEGEKEDPRSRLEVNNTNEEHLNQAPSSSSSSSSQQHYSSAQSLSLSQAESAAPEKNAQERKCVLFDTVTVYHFTRSQGFISIPSQGGSTLGMKRKHFLRRKLSVDLYEEVRRRSRREILLKIKLDKHKMDTRQIHSSYSASSSASNSSTSVATTSSSSDSGEESFSEYSDISDSELDSDSFVFCQPIGVKLRRSLLRASGVGRIDPKEKRECRVIRESRDRSGCNCVNQCIPGLCECSLLGVNCHVDRISFPCGCVSEGCRNPLGRTEFDMKRVKRHHFQTLFKNEEPTNRQPHQLPLASNQVAPTASLEDGHR